MQEIIQQLPGVSKIPTLSYSLKNRLDMLPINEVTWPEIALWYMLISVVTLSMEFNLETAEIACKESSRVFH